MANELKLPLVKVNDTNEESLRDFYQLLNQNKDKKIDRHIFNYFYGYTVSVIFYKDKPITKKESLKLIIDHFNEEQKKIAYADLSNPLLTKEKEEQLKAELSSKSVFLTPKAFFDNYCDLWSIGVSHKSAINDMVKIFKEWQIEKLDEKIKDSLKTISSQKRNTKQKKI